MNTERKPNRLKNHDYNQQGYYYLTICTSGRLKYFGKISNGVMHFSKMGMIANECWKLISDHFNNIELDNYVIMPNHIHGIINIIDAWDNDVENADLRSNARKTNPPKLDSNRTNMLVSKIVHGFKSSVTRKIRRQFENPKFEWQKSYYDHIIRNEHDLERIREYIIDNPFKWKQK